MWNGTTYDAHIKKAIFQPETNNNDIRTWFNDAPRYIYQVIYEIYNQENEPIFHRACSLITSEVIIR